MKKSIAYNLFLSVFCLALVSIASATSGHSRVSHSYFRSYQIRQDSINLLKYVNTLQGTYSKFSFSNGNDYPIVGLPHGVNYWAPQTGKNGDGWKYQYMANKIRGFDEARQVYVWGGAKENVFSLMPVGGKLVVNQKKRAAFFSHSHEIAKPHYYKVTFKNGVTTEIAPTERCGFFQFSYPQSKKAYLVLDGYTGMSKVKIYPEKQKITGYVKNGGAQTKRYFIMHFNQPFVSYGTWENVDNTISKGKTEDEGKGVGAYVQFKKGTQVNVKVTSSLISIDQAEVTLSRELGDYNSVKQVKKAAGKVWNELLSKIIVKGGTQEQKETFYSALYRANLFPMKAYEIDKQGNPYYYNPHDGKIYDGYHYSTFNFWDSFRSLFPLQTILNPTFMSRYVHSLMESYKHNGWFPGGGMVGNHVISVLTGAWAKGIHSFDPERALLYYFRTVTDSGSRPDYKFYFRKGYIPAPNDTTKTSEATARTLAYAYDDFCAYKLAKMTGNKYYKRYFAQYMYNYKNVFDPQTNFMRGKDTNGDWCKYFNPYRWGGPFTEGSSWQWTFAVFHDIQGLINLMGGDKAFNTKLNHLFNAPSDSFLVGSYGYRIHELNEMVAEKMGQYAGGNEPSFQIGYLYTYSGQPWKTQRIVRKAMKKLFGAGPKGYPGDLDGGATAAWYVMSALGFYSVTPGTDQYVIGSPIFKKTIVTMENGSKFVIKAENNGPSNVYIQHATLNGEPYSHNWITQEDIVNGGILKFEMGPQPNKNRGIKDEDKPFSLTKHK